jgi:hypothetical protein
MGMQMQRGLKVLENDIFGNDQQHRFEVTQIQCAPQPLFQTPMTGRLRDFADVGGSKEAVREIAVLLGVADAYERAVQALRDVRHLLPPEGVAVVDAVLTRAS